MATRARTLADYVSSGDELALKAPITNAALVTPNLGTPSAGVLTNATGLVATTGLTASGTKSSGTFLRGDNTWDAAGLTSVGHIIQQSPIVRNVVRTSTTSTSQSAGYELFSMTISDLLVANTRIRIQINAGLWHENGYGGFINVSRTIEGGTQVNNVFENIPSDGQGVVYLRDGAQTYAQQYYHYNDEEDLTNSVGDSVVYRINIGTQNASYPTYINRGSYGTFADTGKAGCNGTIWEVSK